MQYKQVIEEMEIEIKKIEKIFEDYRPLLEKVSNQEPTFIELSSLAMLWHSFYNGLENIFSRIAKRIDKACAEFECGKHFLAQDSRGRQHAAIFIVLSLHLF